MKHCSTKSHFAKMFNGKTSPNRSTYFQERHEAILEPSKKEEAVCDMRFRVQEHLRVVLSIRPELFERIYLKYPNLVSRVIRFLKFFDGHFFRWPFFPLFYVFFKQIFQFLQQSHENKCSSSARIRTHYL